VGEGWDGAAQGRQMATEWKRLQAERKAAVCAHLQAPEGKDQQGAGQGKEKIFISVQRQVCGE